MANLQEQNAIYQEVLGRNIDSSGAETYANMSAEDLRSTLMNSQEKAFKDNRGKLFLSEDEWKNTPSMFGVDGHAGMGRGTYADYKKKRTEELETEYKESWKEQTADSAYNDTAKRLFQSYLSQGMSVDEMKFHMGGSNATKLAMLYEAPKARGDEFYKTHKDTDEFTESTGGQIVWLKDTTPVDSDYYEDVTEKYGGRIPAGYKAYRDTGSKGGGGIVASFGDKIGMNEFESEDNWLGKGGRVFAAGVAGGVTGGPIGAMNAGGGMFAGEFLGMNEGYAYTDLWTLNTGTRFAGGERSHKKSSDVYTENLGLQEGEWDRYADTAAKVVVSAAAIILSPFTAGQSLWAIPAFTAWQGTSRRVGGTRAEQDNESWGDVAEHTAWDAAAAAIGYGAANGTVATATTAGTSSTLSGAQASAAYGALATAQSKSSGESWSDAAWAGAPAVAGGYSPYAGVAATTASTYARGGTIQEAAIAGGTSAASYEAARYLSNSPAKAAAAAMGISFMGTAAQGTVGGGRYSRNTAGYSLGNAAVAGAQGYNAANDRNAKLKENQNYNPPRVVNSDYVNDMRYTKNKQTVAK